MASLRVKLGFAAATDPVLEASAGRVLAGLYAHPGLYPQPPLPALRLSGHLTDFTNAAAAQAQGGTQATAAKREAAAALIAALRQLAMYVQMTVQANPAFGLSELLASGFEAVITRHTRHPLAQPKIRAVVNAGAGRLALKVGAVPNARAYEARWQAAGGPRESAGGFTSTRGLALAGLTPGTMYTMQVRAVGGSTGYSEWSDPVSHRSL